MVKNRVFLVLLFLMPLHSLAQLDASFPDSNYHWNEGHASAPNEGPISKWDRWNGTVFDSGDTLIQGVKYRKIYYRYHAKIFSFDTLDYIRTDLAGLIRNDKQNKKVYFTPCHIEMLQQAADEILLYDFDLHIGNVYPVTLHNYQIDSNIIVMGIDSLVDANQVKRKVFQLNYKNMTDTLFCNLGQVLQCGLIVEGIGSVRGLLTNRLLPCFEYCDDNMECFSVNDSSIGFSMYDSLKYVSCIKNLFLGVDHHYTEKIQVSPNPFNDRLLINLEVADIKMYDAMGRIVQVEYNFIDGRTSIHTSHILPGFYYVCVNTSDGMYYSRVIKKGMY